MIRRPLVGLVENRQHASFEANRLPAPSLEQRPVVGQHLPRHVKLQRQIAQRQPAGREAEHAARVLDGVALARAEDDRRMIPFAAANGKREVGYLQRLFFVRTVELQFDDVAVVGSGTRRSEG